MKKYCKALTNLAVAAALFLAVVMTMSLAIPAMAAKKVKGGE